MALNYGGYGTNGFVDSSRSTAEDVSNLARKLMVLGRFRDATQVVVRWTEILNEVDSKTLPKGVGQVERYRNSEPLSLFEDQFLLAMRERLCNELYKRRIEPYSIL